jgi:flagellar protein FliS
MFRFLNGARLCLERGERSRASEQLSRTHAILSELYLALDHHAAPELCRNLAGVYGFSMDRITQAMAQGDVQSVDDAIRVLSPLREAWKVAVPEAARELGLRKR